MTTSSHRDMADVIRFLSADAVQAANSGHPGMPMGMADVATVLFSRFLKFDPTAPKWPDRDRFVLSAGHGSMLLYALLYLTGYEDMTLDEIKNFRQLGARTCGHPEYGHAAGIEATAGPLGQGIAMAVGMALSERMLNARFGDDIVDHYTYAVAGDGCLMEGISQEAISMAGHLCLTKLIVLWDDNSICIDGATSATLSDDQLARFAASRWNVQSVDGHDAKAVAAAIEKARASDKPSLIGCRTIIGYGAPNKQGTSATHGSPLGNDEIAAARKKLGWDHGPFEVPDAVLSSWRQAGKRGVAERAAWEKRLAAADNKEEFNRMIAGGLPENWPDIINDLKRNFAKERPKPATRQASGKVLEALTAAIPGLIGGSADLTGSVNTKTPSTKPVTAADFSGRYIHYGVREHAMAAVMNGMALHGGFIPYGGTFLVFADYMRGAIRMSALMGQRVIYVLTHDSIGLGEDGPTHQPVETLAGLRAMPNFNVFRPADAVETAECWALALAAADTPSAMVLTRQGLPTLRAEHTDQNRCARGAYVLAEAEGGKRKVTLLATGSEVSLAMEARDRLQADGIPAAVVSMPCWELFDAQDAAYRSMVLGPSGAVRVGVEAAISLGWDRYLGDNGVFIGMKGFGASAPAERLYEHFGITTANIVAAAKEKL
ncbi:MAG: transketolase [Rhodospirillales bacterium RIFCSPLOWO2_12_FULL_58_28]|nr:MAG: transketolase [Rhodospirillales bacterium RIFCSPLOWO2_02_FULL_58_16]OHC78481.1 MAG: transketolase [Rhodospirillales bacterium RIFCSPLOWO2_12_FULL_58_28]